MRFIDGYQGSDLLSEPELAAEAESAAAVERALAQAKGQGFACTPKERRALEDHAMAAAKRYFSGKGFEVEDVSRGRSYDLLCTGKLKELHVEVKGTTTAGESIVLTRNEVKHAGNGDNSCALFVLHSIRLRGQKASGGTPLILNPWQLQHAQLTPVSYTYRLR
jgi:hypothetical protein